MAASDFSSIIDVVKGMVNDPVVVNCHTFMQVGKNLNVLLSKMK